MTNAAAGLLGAAACLIATPASAHAFGQRYDLPLPLWLYLGAAGAAVAVSFIAMGLFLGKARAARYLAGPVTGPSTPLTRIPPALSAFLQILSVALFVLILATGFFGNQKPTQNFSPVFVWVIWWVGLAFFSALVGNLWSLINPWSIIHRWIMGDRPAVLTYPKALGRWPAVLLFFAFAWIELVGRNGADPDYLASVIVIYSVITWIGMALFGRDLWLRNGEAFTAVFGILARFAPLMGTKARWIDLRWFGSGLLSAQPLRWSDLAFVLLLLSTVTFDGVMATPLWNDLMNGLLDQPAVRNFLIAMRNSGVDPMKGLQTVVLLAVPLAFFTVYMIVNILSALLLKGPSAGELARAFALTLVPIAIAYHLAHYLTYMLITGQQIIPLLSDPFGWGWDLFGTKSYRINIAVMNAKDTWYFSVVAIVVGHVAAVVLAHLTALKQIGSGIMALLGQIPMTIFMVCYTILSLWILSQPIVE